MKGDNLQWKDNAFSEYLAHGVARPTAMLRQGRYKLHYSLGDQPQLYDLAQDPNEFSDLVLAKTHQGEITCCSLIHFIAHLPHAWWWAIIFSCFSAKA